MKKILLGTTTLISAAGLFAGAALAETPKVTVGGDSAFELAWRSDDLDSNQNHQAFLSLNTVKFRVDGKSDSGLGYGAGIDMNADTTNPNTRVNNGTNASRTFIYLDGNWGRAEMGSDLGAQQTMKVDATNVAHATGGIDGHWRLYANMPTSPSRGFWVRPTLDLQHGVAFGTNAGDGSQENLNKFTYYTPRFSGFQAGVSYIVNSVDRGQAVTPANTTAGVADNIWTGGLSYQGKFDNVGIDLAATGEHGDSMANTRNDLATWNVGAKFAYMGFGLAGSYGSIGDSLQTKTAIHDNTHYWTLGGSYETGPWGASVTWMESTAQVAAGGTDDFRNVSVGADYKLAPGLTPFVEVSWFDFNGTGGSTTTTDNTGTVAIVGTSLSF